MNIQISSLPLTGLLFLSPSLFPLSPLTERLALTSRSSWLDVLLVSPGMQQPLNPTDLNRGEYPACAAMTTGYAFRVENQATVWFLQQVGRTGCLTTLNAFEEEDEDRDRDRDNSRAGMLSFGFRVLLERVILHCPLILLLAYDYYYYHCHPMHTSSTTTTTTTSFSSSSSESSLPTTTALPHLPLLIPLTLLLTSRLLAHLSLASCLPQASSWHGAREPGVQGDLIVLLSSDRWIRLRGPVDALKAATSGAWLQQSQSETVLLLRFLGTLCVYLAAILVACVELRGQVALGAFVVAQGGVVAAWNQRKLRREGLSGPGWRIGAVDEKLVKRYARRLDMADELVRESAREDWALKLGLINRKTKQSGEEKKMMEKRSREKTFKGYYKDEEEEEEEEEGVTL